MVLKDLNTVTSVKEKTEGAERIQERLDCVLANPSWLQIYPHTQVTHLPKLYSDHCPVLVDLLPNLRQVTYPF